MICSDYELIIIDKAKIPNLGLMIKRTVYLNFQFIFHFCSKKFYSKTKNHKSEYLFITFKFFFSHYVILSINSILKKTMLFKDTEFFKGQNKFSKDKT